MEKKTPVKDNRRQLAGAAPSSEQVIGSIEDVDKRRMAYFKKLMTKGEVSKAYRAIVSDAKVLPYSLDGLQFLQSKNPAASPGEAAWNWDEEYIGAEDPILITFEGVVKLIRSAPKGASCGVDNFPVDILKQLTKTVTKKEFPTDTRLFLDLLIGFLNIVFTHGQCPPGVLSFYDAGEAIRLRQGATKVRPIGKATTYRKVVDVAQQLPHRQDLQTAFGDIQYCGASFGTERMQNSMNIHLSTRSDLTYSASDYSDAYCHVKRSKILSGVARVMPEILSSTQRRLEAVQDVIYFGSEEGPVSIKQAIGLTQGQATSGQLYSLGIHPLNEELSALAHQHESGILSAYIDDVKAHSAAELIAGIIAI